MLHPPYGPPIGPLLAGRRADFKAFPIRIRPKSGPEARDRSMFGVWAALVGNTLMAPHLEWLSRPPGPRRPQKLPIPGRSQNHVFYITH